MTGSKKMMIIYIWEILKKYSDADHKLSQQDIINHILNDYGMKAERKAIARNITELQGFDLDISCSGGYYLREREFENCELRLLVDSVLGSRHIPTNQTKDIIEKLNGLSNIYFKKKLKHVTNIDALGHTNNKDLFYTIDILDEAIENKKQVTFHYNDYGIDKKYHHRGEHKRVVNPYQMAVTNGRYYLIGNIDKYENIVHFRLDRISEIEILNNWMKPMEQIKELKHGLDFPKHMAEHIYMFSGESVWVKFKIKKHLIGEVIDWFGTEINITDDTENFCTVHVKVNENAMLYWMKQYLDATEVLEPQSLRDNIKKCISEAAEKYGVSL